MKIICLFTPLVYSLDTIHKLQRHKHTLIKQFFIPKTNNQKNRINQYYITVDSAIDNITCGISNLVLQIKIIDIFVCLHTSSLR